MRAIVLTLTLAIAGCTAPGGPYPSLQPRAAEAIDPRVPVPEPVLSATPTAGLVQQLEALVGQAESGDLAFRPAAEHAVSLAEAAGPKESESWVIAQQALSVAVAARAPVARALGDIDALGARRIQTLGGIGAADLKAINAAAARVAEIDDREAATIARLQGQLSR